MSEEFSSFFNKTLHQKQFIRESIDLEIKQPIELTPFSSFESCETAIKALKSATKQLHSVPEYKDDFTPEDF